MGEIEKLYRNLGIDQVRVCTANDCLDMSKCSDCCFNKVPETTLPTEEKQFRLIKWLARNKGGVMIAFSTLESCEYNVSTGYYHCVKHRANYKSDEDLGITIVTFINDLWEDLTTEEKEEIKEILK